MRSLRIAREDLGQSLVEVALVLPLLLLIVLGLVDAGRLFSFKVAVTNAAREAGIHAAREPAATLADVCQRARTELGAAPLADPFADPCNGAPIFVTCVRGSSACDAGIATSDRYSYLYRTLGDGGSDVAVSVRYDVTLLTGYLVGSVFRVNPVSVSARAAYPGLGQ
jgi:Flp pilus assembly protein TadG